MSHEWSDQDREDVRTTGGDILFVGGVRGGWKYSMEIPLADAVEIHFVQYKDGNEISELVTRYELQRHDMGIRGEDTTPFYQAMPGGKKMDNNCPDCGRVKSKRVEDILEGGCPKWNAVRDSEAHADCDKHVEVMARRLKDSEDAKAKEKYQPLVRGDTIAKSYRFVKHGNNFITYPDHWPPYRNGKSDPCDMIQGPCCCGAWHDLREWSLEPVASGNDTPDRSKTRCVCGNRKPEDVNPWRRCSRCGSDVPKTNQEELGYPDFQDNEMPLG